MQFYWKCEECDETNAYPDVKECETCGAPMTAAAEKRVLLEQKEEERRQAQIKKAERLKKKEAREAKFALLFRKCTRFSSVLMRTLAIISVIFTVVLFVQNADKVDFDDSISVVSDNIHHEYLVHKIDGVNGISLEIADKSDQLAFLHKSFLQIVNNVKSSISSSANTATTNIQTQFKFLKSSYEPTKKVATLIEDLVEFILGKVENLS